MNFLGTLAPLYLLGLAAISFPLVFHLIRRTPSGETKFSSLMFLQPSPPRITRRSRLDNILLLLLRAAVLGLLAFAFTRPLFRSGLPLDLSGVRNRGIAILVDVSGSMQRGGIWDQVNKEVGEVLRDLEPGDRVVLFAYDESLRVLVDLEENTTATESQIARIRSAMAELRPGWQESDLPSALIQTVDHVLATSQGEDELSTPLNQLILISDLQSSAELVDLQDYEWPQSLRLSIRNVAPPTTGNAAPRVLRDEVGEDRSKGSRRVRIANSASSEEEQFSVHWVQGDGRIRDGRSVFVPSGESRVVRVPLDSQSAEDPIAVRLIGDRVVFDNDFYLGAPQPTLLRIGFLGEGNADENGTLPYFLRRALIDRRQRSFDFVTLDTDQPLPSTLTPREVTPGAESVDGSLHWLVVATAVDSATQKSIVEFAERGGRVLVVLPQLDLVSQDSAETVAQRQADWESNVAAYLDCSVSLEESQDDGFALLGAIDFGHPVFKPFADPRFSNFTGVHFWKHRRLDMATENHVRTVARFDNGDPYLVEREVGDGLVFVMTSGWTTRESQLALSTKFLPMVAKLADDRARETGNLYYNVGDVVELPEPVSGETVEVRLPDGSVVRIDDDRSRLLSTEIPGRYDVMNVESPYTFAVNVTAEESEITPIRVEQLESVGILLGEQPPRSEQMVWQGEVRDRELEGRQKLWLWLIIAAVLFMLAEMAIAGRIQALRFARWNSAVEST